jgi:hypothetical protein
VFVWLATAAVAQSVVELPSGEFLGSVRARSIGGSIVAISESATSQLLNPATAAVRRPYLSQNPFSPDLTLQAIDHPVITEGLTWLFGPGPEPALPTRQGLWQVGTNLKMSRHSVALHLRGDGWTLPHGDTIRTSLAGAAWAHSEDVFVIGVMPLAYGIHREGQTRWGPGAAVGALIAPIGLPLRLGASARTPLRTAALDLDGPAAARLPWQLVAGASWTVGAENVPGRYAPDKVHLGDDDSPTLLLSTQLVGTGGSADAIGLLPWAAEGQAVTAPPSLAVHAGAEADVARRILRLRAGAYTEPGRFEGMRILGHLTGGVAVQVFRYPPDLPWRLTGSIDASGTGRVSWGFGLETW